MKIIMCINKQSHILCNINWLSDRIPLQKDIKFVSDNNYLWIETNTQQKIDKTFLVDDDKTRSVFIVKEVNKNSYKVASSGENTNAAAVTPTTLTTNRIALTTLDNALAQATSGGAVLVAEIQISPVATAAGSNAAGTTTTTTTTIIKTANNPPPGTTTVQAVAQQMRLSPLQSAHATNSTGGRDITSSGSGVMTGRLSFQSFYGCIFCLFNLVHTSFFGLKLVFRFG